MTRLRTLLLRLRALLRSRQMDRDIDDEITGHLAEATDEYIQRGLSPEEAHWAALRSFGGVTQTKEVYRQVRSFTWLDDLMRDLRYALRMLRRSPGFTTVAVFTLALGIGANTAIFGLVDAVLIRSLPFPDADRLGMVWEEAPRLGYPKTDVSPANYVDWANQSDAFDELAAYVGNAFNHTGEGLPERLDGIQATPNLFSVLRVKPALGRLFLPTEGAPGNDAFVILSHSLWQRRFGADAGVLGRSIALNARPHVVVGVMPQGFQFPREDTQLWIPIAFARDTGTRGRDTHFLRVVGRLKATRSWTEAQTEFNTIAARLTQAYPSTNTGYGALVVPLQDEVVREARRSLWLLQAAALLVMVVACANIAGLLITRGLGRERETAVRLALGANYRHIVRQLLVGGLALASIGGMLGIFMAAATSRFLETLLPSALRGAVQLDLDWRTAAFTVTVSVIAGLVFGLAPLRVASRLNVTQSLGGRGADRPRDHLHGVLVAAQFAIAVVVVVSTGLLLRTVANLSQVDPGFRTKDVLTARLELSARSPLDDRMRFYREVIARVEALPGVVSAGFTTFLPYTNFGGTSALHLEGQPDLPDGAQFAYRREVTPGYLSTIGVRLLAGRWLRNDDDLAHPDVAIVNEYVARLLGGEALGKRLKLGDADSPWITIVGVVGDIREEGLDTPTQRGTVYLPVSQSREVWYFNPRDLAIRTVGDPTTLVAALQRTVWSISGEQTISNVRVMDALVEAQITTRKMQTGMVTAFAAVVLFLAGLGIYGLMSLVVTSRTQEFGMRMALGADRTRVASSVFRQGLVWLATGTAIGLTITLMVTQSLIGMLYGVTPLDPIALAVGVLLLLAIGCASILLPVLRATRIDPLIALRYD